jgi:hypothetical protein
MGIAELNDGTNTLTIKAELFFYGNAAGEAISFQIATDINTHWGIENAYVKINGRQYKFVMQTIGIYCPQLKQTDINANDDPLKNYFRIEEYAAGDISFVDGIKSNTGYFKLDNLLHNSTTAAHEFGHTMGLEHPEDLDIRGKGVPGIMYPRGTIVDAHFQYDPNMPAGEKGGTMNPIHRKVLQEDIDHLQLEKLKFINGKAIVGAFTSEWHYAHLK